MYALNMIYIEQIPVMNDNYIYILVDKSTNQTACVDPGVTSEVINYLDNKNLGLNFILNTHHHADHIGGNITLKKKYGCKVVGNKNDANRIPGIDIFMEEGDRLSIGNSVCSILEVSGHTNGHISYFFEKDFALFCGDTLFSLGCGRLFEGTPSQMVRSLKKIRSLPDDTKIYCAHEYTEANSRFANYLTPDDSLLKKKIIEIKEKRSRNIPTIPTILSEEKRLNPFLKFDDKSYLDSIGMDFMSSSKNFGRIRKLKDKF